MSKLVSPSVSDSFNAPGRGPGNPADINWKTVAICGGIAVTSAIVFAVVINHSLEQNSRRWQVQLKAMNEAHLASLAKKDEIIIDLFKTIKKLDTPSKVDQPASESNPITTKQFQ